MEYWDIYLADGSKTEKKVLRGNKMNEGEFHLVVHIAIYDQNGNLLIQKRTLNKESFPGYWDFGVGGSAVCGENSQQAAQRELLEEVGILYDFSNQIPLFRSYGIHSFVDFYAIEYDGNICDLVLQTDEVEKIKWASQEEIYEMIENDEFIPYHKSIFGLIKEMSHNRGLHRKR